MSQIYTSEYTATETVSVIPVNIAIYEPAVDYLIVFLNGEMLVEDTDYTLDLTNARITLAESIIAGEVVNFICFKAEGIDIDVSEFGTPQSRNEALIQNMLGGSNALLYPVSRIETLLFALLSKINVDAGDNTNLSAALSYLATNWSTYSTGIAHVTDIPAGGPVAAAIVYKYSADYGAVLILSYHPMFPHPAYCRLFGGEWTTPFWL